MVFAYIQNKHCEYRPVLHTVVQKYLGIFLAYRAAFPAQNAKKLYKLIKNNELEVLGGLRSIKYDFSEEAFSVTFDDRSVETSYLVDATGVCTDIRLATDTLIKKLNEKGVIEPHQFGGVKVDPNTLNIIDALGHRYSNLFMIGGLIRGTHLITNLLEHIAKISQKTATNILDQLE